MSANLCACRYVKTLETSLEAAQRKKMGTDAKVAKKARPRCAPRAFLQRAQCSALCVLLICGVWLHVRAMH